jgi:leader peptidase (prepilin peptidase) / N-methyltransferase
MSVRTVSAVESSRSKIAYFMLVMPILRHLISIHNVQSSEAWTTSCRDCDTPLWPSSSGPVNRCAGCGRAVGARSYVVEVLAVGALGLVALLAVNGASLWESLAATWWLLCAIILGTVDVLVHRLPLRVVAAMLVGVEAPLTVAAAVHGDWAALQRAAIAAVVLGVVFALLCLPRSGLGLGDATLAVPIGFVLGWVGWPAVTAWVIVTLLLSNIAAVAMLVTRRASWKSAIAFGPYMLLGVVGAVAWVG